MLLIIGYLIIIQYVFHCFLLGNVVLKREYEKCIFTQLHKEIVCYY